jgi:hypothetical protein
MDLRFNHSSKMLIARMFFLGTIFLLKGCCLLSQVRTHMVR